MQRAIVGDDELRAVGQVDGHAVTPDHAQHLDRYGQTVNRLIELPEADRVIQYTVAHSGAKDDGSPPRVPCRCVGQ